MSNLPPLFLERIHKQYTDASDLIQALDTTSPTSIRLNPSKESSIFNDARPVPWCKNGRYLEERPKYTLEPLFHGGTFYPQEAGSMCIDFILHTINLPKDSVCLDLCAAPGGKSTLILDYLSNEGLLVANEIIRNRAQILRENITKWGASNCIVTNNEAADFGEMGELFDCILIDAPCSGEGMFRKDLNARQEWSIQNAQHCVVRQEDILTQTWSALKQNGYLFFSTCTFNPEENELQIERFLNQVNATVIELDIPEQWGITSPANGIGYACLPHRIESEGFYFVVLQKNDAHSPVRLKTKQPKKNPSTTLETPTELKQLSEQKDIFIHTHLDYIYGFARKHEEIARYILAHFKCMKWGVRLGTLKGKQLIPDHEWALSHAIPHPFPRAEVSKQTALQFLKGEPIQLEAPNGWVCITYKGIGLGWVKNMGNRVNNYYPKEYRIRMDIHA